MTTNHEILQASLRLSALLASHAREVLPDRLSAVLVSAKEGGKEGRREGGKGHEEMRGER
jgi:hypothetical protein